MSDEEPDTLRLCEACGGTPDEPDECLWCTGGFQDVEQQVRWRKFRRQMRKMSGTYNFLTDTVEELVKRLLDAGGPERIALAMEGKHLLSEWENADPAHGGRSGITVELSDFTKRAIDELTK